ncbi:274_t:CDS:2, partial [Scutellospora calospora]
TGRLLPFNLLPRFSSGLSYVEEEEHKGEIKQDKGANYQHHKIAPPIKRFLDCPYDEFHSKDVQELLSDYKRLSAEIQELGLFSS